MITKAKSVIRGLLPKNAFARGVSVLVGGTASAQVLTILAAPLLTRLYTPEDFGLLAVYASLLALIGVISSLRYELAIPLPEDDAEAANVAVLSLILVGISSLLTTLLVVMLSQPIATTLGVPALANYLWLLPVGVLLAGAYNVFNYWSIRTKRFTTIAGTKLRQALATIAIQLAAFKLGGIALLFGQVAGQSVGTASLGRPALASAGFRQVSWRGIAKAAGRYRRFPIFSTWDALINTASHQLPYLLFAGAFGAAATGSYALAHRITTLPMSLVGSAIAQVFFPTASEAHRTGGIGDLVIDAHRRLAYIGLPPIFLLMIVGPELFAVVFGAVWRDAGEFVRWMAPWLYLAFVSSPISTVFLVLERQKELLIFQSILFLGRFLGIAIGIWSGGIYLAIVIFSVVSAFCYAGLLFWINSLCGNDPRGILVPTFSAIAVGLLCNAPLLIERLVAYSNPFGWLYASVLVSLLIICYYAILLRKAY